MDFTAHAIACGVDMTRRQALALNQCHGNTTAFTGTLDNVVTQYNGDFGFAEFMLSPWAPSNVRGYLFEMQQCQKLPFGPGTAQEELGRTGSGEETVLWAMYAWHPGDPRAHIKFTGA